MANPYGDYSSNMMNGVLVHNINRSFYFSCSHFTFFPLGCGVHFHNRRPAQNSHAGRRCFCDMPQAPIDSWYPNPRRPLDPHNPELGYDDDYQDGRSTIGVFCYHNHRYNFHYLGHHIPRIDNGGPFLIPETAICSSTHGLFLLRHPPSSTYYIVNPFINAGQEPRNTSWLRLPQPPVRHRPQDPAILTFNKASRTYHVICASKILDGTAADTYRFDVYHSLTRQWSASPMTTQNSGINVSSSVTVSCGSMAYWMASTNTMGRILVGYNADTGDFENMPLSGTGEASVASDSRIQLGRVGENIGIVLVKEDKVESYVLESANDQKVWTPLGFLNYGIPGTPGLQPNQDWFPGTPYPARFEGSRLQVLLWVTHGYLLLWESNSIQRNRTRLVPVQLPPDPNRSASNLSVIAQGFAYLPSSYVAGTYRVIDTLDQEQLQEIAAHE